MRLGFFELLPAVEMIPVVALMLSQNPNLTYSSSADDQLLNNQPVIVAFNNPSYLDVGQSYSQTVNVTLPISAQGT